MATPTNPLFETVPSVLVIPALADEADEAYEPGKPDSARQLVPGLLGYCPGTGVVALGQGNYDAIAGILGLMAGSYLYAETSGYLASTIQKVGNRGRIMLPDVLGMRLAVFKAVFVPLPALGLWVMAQWVPWKTKDRRRPTRRRTG